MTILDRFIEYARISTNSDEYSDAAPSTAKQLIMCELLEKQLKEAGLSDVRSDGRGYVYAKLPANTQKKFPRIGFIAHVDTSPDMSDENIKPRVVEYKGGDIVLNEAEHIVMKAADFERLERSVGKHLIVTDGTTLLGADDKAGVAEILTAVEELIRDKAPHVPIRIGITPDEEIGRGADRFDVKGFGAEFAYTADGGTLGEIEFENFNAASASVVCKGVSIHPGSAKNKLVNAMQVAMDFHAMLPANERPEHTEGYEGFSMLHQMEGGVEEAKLHYIIRDHDRFKFEQKKSRFEMIANYLNEAYGEGTVTVTLKDSYYNMKEKILPVMHVVERAKNAMREAGMDPIAVPIRGGTDGARLSFEGLPCPNLCTGGENFHGRYEYIPVEDMEACVQMIKIILKP
jgi:tripeptide aminopeptidase